MRLRSRSRRGETRLPEAGEALFHPGTGERLDGSSRETLSRHLGTCLPCERCLRTFQRNRELCRESFMEEMPEELRARLRAFLRSRTPGK